MDLNGGFSATFFCTEGIPFGYPWWWSQEPARNPRESQSFGMVDGWTQITIFPSLTPLVVPPEPSKTSKNINKSLEKLIRWDGDFPLITVFPNILVGIAHAEKNHQSTIIYQLYHYITYIYPQYVDYQLYHYINYIDAPPYLDGSNMFNRNIFFQTAFRQRTIHQHPYPLVN